MQTWKIGNVEVTRIEESERTGSMGPDKFFTGFDRAIFESHYDWLLPRHYSREHDRLIISSHSWLVRVGKFTMLVDSCSGNHKYRPFNPAFHMLETPFIERLAAAGVTPEQIDVVMCTHLHADHVGWNTRLENGRWVPTFPNARYVFTEEENRFWQQQIATVLKDNPGRRGVYEDSVLPVIESGQARMLGPESHHLADELRVEHAPGHTPGHIVLQIESNGERALCCGDAIHHPIQLYQPDWNTSFCIDPVLARQTRRRLLDHCVDNDALLMPIHFATPFVTKVLRAGGAYRPDAGFV
ncbi:MBL fold metallo-hydrolase [Ramlibacter sp.]|uniref:MBL fold metallo-hydrolase n=1 Tax=Ramlibacter sp. TaxID=1917967 RepID=UPI003D13BA99